MQKSERQPWIDAVRAIAVVLVVLFHFLIWTHKDVAGIESGLSGHWGDLQQVLARLRMPLLMAVSGLLAASAIQRGWSSVRLRVVTNGWLYLVWLTIYAAFYTVIYRTVAAPALPAPVNTVERFISNIFMPNTVLWFIFAMALFPLILFACERWAVPAWLVLGAAFALWLLFSYGIGTGWFGKLARTFIFFAIGYYGRTLLPRLTSLGWPSAAIAVLTFIVLAEILPDVLSPAFGALLAACVAIATAAIAAPNLFRSGSHTRVASFIGRRTLEIYVVHVPILAVFSLTLRDSAPLREFTATPAGDVVFVLGSTVTIVALCLAVGAALRRIPGVMALPEFVTRFVHSPRERVSLPR